MTEQIELKRLSDVEWEIPMSGDMRVPARILASEELLKDMQKDACLQQVRNTATLEGVVKHVLALSDAHQGYGFPIGGVAAFDSDRGIVSPGGVGYDINCGVRLLSTSIPIKALQRRKSEVLHELTRAIPSGVGRGGERHSRQEICDVLTNGASWAVERGMGTADDLECTEELGRITNANPADVSSRAIMRGQPQLGTLGAGNHFLEVQTMDQVFDTELAATLGLDEDNIAVMIHCGSRGLGHQVASDYIKLMEAEFGFANLADRQLINAPIRSALGEKYLSAMNCAVNFAFCNRQVIMHRVREVLSGFFPGVAVRLVYDVCHNIAKMEEHVVDDSMMQLCVHRKGATRSFGPGRKELGERYRETGQPVLIPGSMGTFSYVLVGTNEAEVTTFGSTAHGAGRLESRTQARKTLRAEEVKRELAARGIEVCAASWKGLVEEAPSVYKDIDEVVRVSHETGTCKLVARMRPLAVMKG